ncbi:hypothetical protein RJ40_11810 [Methanofollis aquaemaris]|uniref:Uncharacterized protein n=1 Tax=Methanofollis aquaemaris TaxID=126734 RepID=A0A8A3S8Z7_9EURY|nr:hypothetical protein [Methanofollis aquaemaris]QSZ68131.1 hypothetical protein RJ40_11810 [Methanofollis aquaemaris]
MFIFFPGIFAAMPRIGIVVCMLLCALTAAGGADTSMMYDEGAGHEAMQSVEERSMNASVHAEMEGLMAKMMEGDLTPAEEDRLVQLMERYPAGYSMMLDRMMGNDYWGQPDGGPWHDMPGMPYYGMMGGVMLLAMALAGIFLLVWLIVGILAIIWLLGLVSKR